MSRYTHYVVIPITGSINVAIESDDPEPSLEVLYKAAMDVPWRLALEEDGDGKVTLGEEIGTHRYLNRGNVCEAVCPEMELLETDDLEG